jgi:hypothetical protein
MSIRGPLSLNLFLEMDTLSVEWCHRSLFQLWARGLEFSRPVAFQGVLVPTGTTWDEALGVTCYYHAADGSIAPAARHRARVLPGHEC